MVKMQGQFALLLQAVVCGQNHRWVQACHREVRDDGTGLRTDALALQRNSTLLLTMRR